MKNRDESITNILILQEKERKLLFAGRLSTK
jgi:hypothetical protein